MTSESGFSAEHLQEYLNQLYWKFYLFAPNAGGDGRFQLTMDCVANLFPAMAFSLNKMGHSPINLTPVEKFARSSLDISAAREIALLFNKYGSDKASGHSYHHLYGHILKNKESFTKVLEIGIGTNNPQMVSSMGENGSPGASLRSFRDFLPNATIYGADYDKSILFTEDRIETFFVDQLNNESLELLGQQIPDDLDLIIDDGMHSPLSCLNTLSFAISRINIGGWIIIEDIAKAAIPFWQVISALMPKNFEQHFADDGRISCVYAAKKIDA